MRILYITTNLTAVGGKEQYDRNTISALRRLKANVRVVDLFGIGFLAKAFFIARVALRAIFLRPSVIFCGHISFSPISYSLKRFFGIPYIVFTHGIEVLDMRSNLYQKALREARLVVTLSAYTEKTLYSQVPDLKDKVFV